MADQVASDRGVVTLADARKPVHLGFIKNNLRDYGMTAPTYLGISVKPEIDVSADFHLDAP